MNSIPCPDSRLRTLNDTPVRHDGEFVLYWMIAERRPGWNFALQHAVDQAVALDRPLLVLEPLDCSYRWASDRFHAFIIQGMVENKACFDDTPVRYYPYVEDAPGNGAGLLQALSARACLIVTDDRPGYRFPALLARAASRVKCRLDAVDGAGMLPIRDAPKGYKRAVDFRRYIHKVFADRAPIAPVADPLDAPIVEFATDISAITARWSEADLQRLTGAAGLAELPIDHTVPPVPSRPGGPTEGAARLEAFVSSGLARYPDRNHPDAKAASGLSPWLHFGHLGGAQVAWKVLDESAWAPHRMDATRVSKQEGAWGLSPGEEGFLEEVVTWRELCFQTAQLAPEDHALYRGLPQWARTTLDEHRDDPREHLYTLEQLAAAQTDDPVWNAAQRQLVGEGVIHNYLRMLWGKRVLQWTESPEKCFEVLVELNNRYALDGRDPNSYGGIGWVLGRYDRAWGPERPIFGKIRYMTSGSTLRKLRLKAWLQQWGPPDQPRGTS